jgi:AMP deaminase
MAESFVLLWLFAAKDRFVNHSGMYTRVASVGRLVTPRSPGGNAFDDAGDSDDDGTELTNVEDMLFDYGHIDSTTDFTNAHVCVVLAT